MRGGDHGRQGETSRKLAPKLRKRFRAARRPAHASRVGRVGLAPEPVPARDEAPCGSRARSWGPAVRRRDISRRHVPDRRPRQRRGCDDDGHLQVAARELRRGAILRAPRELKTAFEYWFDHVHDEPPTAVGQLDRPPTVAMCVEDLVEELRHHRRVKLERPPVPKRASGQRSAARERGCRVVRLCGTGRSANPESCTVRKPGGELPTTNAYGRLPVPTIMPTIFAGSAFAFGRNFCERSFATSVT
jgi:hypothetical protein